MALLTQRERGAQAAASNAPPPTPTAPAAVPATPQPVATPLGAGDTAEGEARQARPPTGAKPQQGNSPTRSFFVGAVRGVT